MCDLRSFAGAADMGRSSIGFRLQEDLDRCTRSLSSFGFVVAVGGRVQLGCLPVSQAAEFGPDGIILGANQLCPCFGLPCRRSGVVQVLSRG